MVKSGYTESGGFEICERWTTVSESRIALIGHSELEAKPIQGGLCGAFRLWNCKCQSLTDSTCVIIYLGPVDTVSFQLSRVRGT